MYCLLVSGIQFVVYMFVCFFTFSRITQEQRMNFDEAISVLILGLKLTS